MSEIARVHELIDQGLEYTELSRICSETSHESLVRAQGHLETAADALALALESYEKAGAELRVASNKSTGTRENFSAARRKYTEAAGEGTNSSEVNGLLHYMGPSEFGQDIDHIVRSSSNAHKNVTNILRDARLQGALDLTRQMLAPEAFPVTLEAVRAYATNNVHYIRQTATEWKNSI